MQLAVAVGSLKKEKYCHIERSRDAFGLGKSQ